mgnify:FL=1
MSKIGHNRPPRDINWKSISLNIWAYKDLKVIQQHIQKQRDLHNPELLNRRVTLPMAIEILTTQYYLNNILMPKAWSKK